MMAELDYDALQQLADAATSGPWEAFEDSNEHLADCPPTMEWLVTATDPGEEFYEEIIDWGNRGRREDAEFIAASRSAVPALLDRVRELEGGRGSEWARNAEKRARESARSWVKASKRIDKLVAERDAALSTIAKVRELHQPYEGASGKWCRHCIDFDGPWPCSTAAALGSVPSTGEGNE